MSGDKWLRVEKKRDRLSKTNAERRWGWKRMWWNKRFISSASFEMQMSFHILNAEPCCFCCFCHCFCGGGVFSVLPAFRHSWVIIIQPSQGGTDKQEGNMAMRIEKCCTALLKQSKKEEVKHWKKWTFQIKQMRIFKGRFILYIHM